MISAISIFWNGLLRLLKKIGQMLLDMSTAPASKGYNRSKGIFRDGRYAQ